MLSVRGRLRLLVVVFTVPFAIIIGRLYFIQIVRHDRFASASRGAGQKMHRDAPRRGRIVTADGAVLADNDIQCDLYFTLDEFHPRERIFAYLEKALNICDDDRHGASDELCVCGGLEATLFDVLGSPEAVELSLLDGHESARRRVLLVDNIAHDSVQRLGAKWREKCATQGVYFVSSEPGRGSTGDGQTYEMFVEPQRILRMELALLELARRTGVPYGLPDPELRQTLRGSVEAAVQAVREHCGGVDSAARKRNLGRRRGERQEKRLLVKGVSKEVISDVYYSSDGQYRGLFPRRRHRRVYPMGDVASIVTGHLRKVGARHLERWKREGRILKQNAYSPTDLLSYFASLRGHVRFADELLGAQGLEQTYDDMLRGLYGMQIIVRDVENRPVARQPFEPVAPVAGDDVRTTIDAELQNRVFKELAYACGPYGHARAGSVAVMALKASPDTIRYLPHGVPGGILAMACAPTFDANRLRSPSYYREIQEVPEKALYNRLVSPPRYLPPGSVFKLIVAIAALESGILDDRWKPLDSDETYTCRRIFDERNPRNYHCTSQHLEIDLERAITVSCNCFFYHLARDRLNSSILWSWARNFGFGRGVGIDLGRPPEVQRGPSGRLERSVPQGQMPAFGIGHIFVEASPLQVLRAVAGIALDGHALPWPYLVTPQVPESTGVERPQTMALVKSGMRGVISAPGGTANRDEFGLRAYNAAAKTGTAQISSASSEYFSWIAGFAPADDPEIAFVVCLENTSLTGGEATAPLLKTILAHYAERAPDRYLSEGSGR